MALNQGDRAPDFPLPEGGRFTDLRKPAVVYFYPKDDTPGCTIEAQEFRDVYDEIRAAGAEVFGVSTDDAASHDAFCQKYNLNFPLIPDPDKAISQQYGVLGDHGYANRVTYLVDRDGVVRQVWPQVNPQGHAREILQAINNLA
ncbi:MAG TPA: peroxiredoxin [bacterium]|nr:peroxiredoxin [bacterium]